jgi:hypothetical protein
MSAKVHFSIAKGIVVKTVKAVIFGIPPSSDSAQKDENDHFKNIENAIRHAERHDIVDEGRIPAVQTCNRRQ